jgi:hypothetical protein
MRANEPRASAHDEVSELKFVGLKADLANSEKLDSRLRGNDEV